ncbi:MAG: polysaccharide deacetylase family protein [Armatimonadetes bacterium]|nr:polysaccharide deacetylase family protein [Armatimonadota bacterium]
MLTHVKFLMLLVGVLLASGCQSQNPIGERGPKPPNPQNGSAREDRFWARALQEIYKSPEELKAQHKRELRKGIVYRKLIHGDPGKKTVALTFDDGPHPDYTPRLLAILRKYHVKATFFVVGFMAEKHPELIEAEAAAGEEIGNHTYHHVNLTRIPENEVRTEWQACNDVIQAITGKAMTTCRPPGGDYDAAVIQAAQEQGLTTVLWTDDPADYARPSDAVLEQRTLSRIRNGAVILLHDGVQQTIDILPQIIERLQRQGYRFQTASEMAKDAGRLPPEKLASSGSRR